MKMNSHSAINAVVKSFHEMEFYEENVDDLGSYINKQLLMVHQKYQEAVMEIIIGTVMDEFPLVQKDLKIDQATWDAIRVKYKQHSIDIVNKILSKFQTLAEDPKMLEQSAEFVQGRIARFIEHTTDMIQKAEKATLTNLSKEDKMRYDAINQHIIAAIK